MRMMFLAQVEDPYHLGTIYLDIFYANSYEEAARIAKEIAKGCGYDPDTANFDQIWEAYAEAPDMTFVMRHTIDFFPSVQAYSPNGTDVIGYYDGKPHELSTEAFLERWMGDF